MNSGFKHAILGCVGVLSLASSAQALPFFVVDPNPDGIHLFLTKAENAAHSTGSVVTANDVNIDVIGNSDFANGFATIKPNVDHKLGNQNNTLTSLLFTPVDDQLFGAFSFRGQTNDPNQMLTVLVTDGQGDPAEMFNFTIDKANADFDRIGILSTLGKTIRSVLIYSAGGFKEGKQYEFSTADCPDCGPGGHGVPEPASWALMIAGFGMVGGAMRRKSSSLTA